MQHILFRILIRRPQILHQLLYSRITRHQQFNMLTCVPVPEWREVLPGFLFGGEDVDFGVFCWEGVVIAGWEADAASMVAETGSVN